MSMCVCDSSSVLCREAFWSVAKNRFSIQKRMYFSFHSQNWCFEWNSIFFTDSINIGVWAHLLYLKGLFCFLIFTKVSSQSQTLQYLLSWYVWYILLMCNKGQSIRFQSIQNVVDLQHDQFFAVNVKCQFSCYCS